MKQISAFVISNAKLLDLPGAAYLLMRIKAPEIASISSPGQFLMLRCGNNTLLRRPISISSVIQNDTIELLYSLTQSADNTEIYATANAGTKWLSTLCERDHVDVIGPLGNGFEILPESHSVLIIAGGIGIAPLRFLAETALSQDKKVRMLIGAGTADGILPARLLPPGVNLVVTTDDGSLGQRGRVTEICSEYVRDSDQVFACGPLAMYTALDKQMENWPVQKPIQVSLEVRMGCGTGMCYSCSIKTRQGMRRVCKEGPIFNIKDIIWQEVRI